MRIAAGGHLVDPSQVTKRARGGGGISPNAAPTPSTPTAEDSGIRPCRCWDLTSSDPRRAGVSSPASMLQVIDLGRAARSPECEGRRAVKLPPAACSR